MYILKPAYEKILIKPIIVKCSGQQKVRGEEQWIEHFDYIACIF